MEVLGIILLIIAYTVGVITVFLELICYYRKIEYIETIFFSISFVLLIFSISISSLFGFQNSSENIVSNTFILLTMVGLGLTTPLNIFAERQLNIVPAIKNGLYIISCILVLLIIGNIFFKYQYLIDTMVSIFLGVSIISSMLLVRNTKPGQRIKHREKIERKMAVVVMVTMPLTMFVEFFAKEVQFLSFLDTGISLTVPILFIILATSKFLDDLTRLSLFKTENSVTQTNVKDYNLTPRELEIADLLIKGYTYAKIGESLFISMPTVKTHVSNVYKKVEVNNKMELFYALTN